MKPIVIILAVIGVVSVAFIGGCVVLIGVGAAAASEMVDEDGNFTMPTYGQPAVITIEEFRAIRTGMSYQQVVDVIGAKGEVMSEVSIPGAGGKTAMVAWTNPGGSNANVTFQGGKVMSKAQFGLPKAAQ